MKFRGEARMPLHVTITSKDDYVLIGENIKVKVTRKRKVDGTFHSKHISVSIDAPKEVSIKRKHNFQEENDGNKSQDI
jgi:sRNA-binding carbon storage regulator CsrA